MSKTPEVETPEVEAPKTITVIFELAEAGNILTALNSAVRAGEDPLALAAILLPTAFKISTEIQAAG